MKFKCALLAAGAAASLAGCAIGGPSVVPTTYMIELPAAKATGVPQFTGSLRVANVRVAAPFGQSGLVYRLDDVRYVTDSYHAFAADPRELLGSRIAEWLDRSGSFRSVAAPGSARPASHVLEINVAELYGDFREGRPPAAVLVVEFALIDQRNPRSTVSYVRSIEQCVELPAASAENLVRGYGTALTNALSQVVSDLERTANGATRP